MKVLKLPVMPPAARLEALCTLDPRACCISFMHLSLAQMPGKHNNAAGESGKRIHWAVEGELQSGASNRRPGAGPGAYGKVCAHTGSFPAAGDLQAVGGSVDEPYPHAFILLALYFSPGWDEKGKRYSVNK